MTDGSNTDLRYTFADGWSVEVHGQRHRGLNNEFLITTFAIINSDNEEVYEGEVELKPDVFVDVPNFFSVLCAVIYTLRQDWERVQRPGRYTESHDRGILIANDERIRLWLSMSEKEMFQQALTEIAGSPRKGRRYYEHGVWGRAAQVG